MAGLGQAKPGHDTKSVSVNAGWYNTSRPWFQKRANTSGRQQKTSVPRSFGRKTRLRTIASDVLPLRDLC
jgi:hypothetical protein